jgi:hypothetical protein
MLVRLGNVLYWLCTGVAAVFVLGGAVLALTSLHSADRLAEEELTVAAVFAAVAITVWLIGRAARYFMAGK